MILPEDGAYSALHTEKAYKLDITDYREKTTVDLSSAIEQAVSDTQSVVARAYPDRIVMTAKQYDLLNNSFLQIGDVGQEYWLYRTKYNIMEVEVKK